MADPNHVTEAPYDVLAQTIDPTMVDDVYTYDYGNTTSNETTGPVVYYETWEKALITVVLSIIIIGTVIGNVLVILAVALVKKLRTPSNILIVSLAVSDLCVALLDMPFATVYEVTQTWSLGETMCDLWVSLDVMLCTASILNLCMISIDRYFVITRPFTYMVKRTPKLMGLMITVAWVSSALISIPPLIGWKQEWVENTCQVSNELGYQIYATIGAFYCPLTVMIVVYGRIFRISARIAKAEARSNFTNPNPHSVQPPTSTSSTHKQGGGFANPFKRDSNEENHNYPNGSAKRSSKDSQEDQRVEMLPKKNNQKSTRFPFRGMGGKRQSNSANRESKATKTLGVIMGAFTACWLPFFILALIKPFNVRPPSWLDSTFLWLGFLNSFLNPLIYAKFNRDFRKPFKEILCFRCKGLNRKVRSDSYVDQFGGPRDSARRESGDRRESMLPPPSRRESARPVTPIADSVIRCNPHGDASVQLGNGTPVTDGEAKL